MTDTDIKDDVKAIEGSVTDYFKRGSRVTSAGCSDACTLVSPRWTENI
jgi:hypothetical protein